VKARRELPTDLRPAQHASTKSDGREQAARMRALAVSARDTVRRRASRIPLIAQELCALEGWSRAGPPAPRQSARGGLANAL
jgi:hypothetical protein